MLKEQNGQLFSKLITQITLPALIFVSLARTEVVWSEGEDAKLASKLVFATALVSIVTVPVMFELLA